MILKIDYLSGLAVYRQIIDAVKEDLASGRLLPDQELPSVRQLAAQIKVNPNTVARAYRELISEGVVYSRQGMGFYIRQTHKEEWQDIKNEMKRLVVEAKVKQVDKKELEHSVQDTIRDIYTRETK